MVQVMSIVTVFIRSILDFFSSLKPTCESKESFDIFVSPIIQPRVNDPLFNNYFKTLK